MNRRTILGLPLTLLGWRQSRVEKKSPYQALWNALDEVVEQRREAIRAKLIGMDFGITPGSVVRYGDVTDSKPLQHQMQKLLDRLRYLRASSKPLALAKRKPQGFGGS